MAVRILCPVLAKKAKEELGEEVAIMKTSIEHIKQWISKQPHLCNNIRTDDQWLVMFLRGSKYSLENAKKKLDKFNQYKVIYKELTSCVDPFQTEMQTLLKSGFFLPTITTKTMEGTPELFIIRLPVLKDKSVSIETIFQLALMVSLILAVEYDNMTICGQSIIVDANADAKDIAALMNPTNLKKAIIISQDTWPVRQKGIHFVNISPLWERLITIIKIFMNEKNRNRMVIHKDCSTLKEYFPMEQLPNEYGGTGGSFAELTGYWKNKVESYKDWFLNDSKYKSDESKRPQTGSKSFDMKGSFRELAVD